MKKHNLFVILSKRLMAAAGFSALLICCSDQGLEPPKADGLSTSPSTNGLGSSPSANGIVTTPSANGIITTPSANGITTSPSVNGIITSPSATQAVTTLNKVDLMVGRSSTAVGTVLVQVKSLDGTIVASSELPVSALSTTVSWVTFLFPEGSLVTEGEMYRLEVTRSHPPVTGNGQVYLGGAVSSSNDPYPYGASDRSATVFDYTFRTYANGAVDQQQLRYTSPVPVVPSNLNVSIRWQEFMAMSTNN